MKTALRSLLPLAALSLAAKAAPFLAIGDSAELFLTGTLGAKSDDNILLTEEKISDMVYEVTPGLDFRYGTGSQTTAFLRYQEAFNFYGDYTDMNTELSSVEGGISYDNQKTKAFLDASWKEKANNTYDLRYPSLPAGVEPSKQYLVHRDQFASKIGGEVGVSEKSSLGSAVKYDTIDFKSAGFVDITETTVPLNYYYQISQKVDLSLDFSYRKSNLEVGVDSKDFYYGMGGRGEFTEKLKGTVSVGYTQRDFDTGDHENTVGLNANLEYAVSEKTKILLGALNDFGNSGDGEAFRRLQGNIGFSCQMAQDWILGADFLYSKLNYLGATARTDEYFDTSVKVTYLLSSLIGIEGAYTFRKLNSGMTGYDFDNNLLSLSAKIRY